MGRRPDERKSQAESLIEIIEFVANRGAAIKASEVERELGIKKSTAYRQLKTLVLLDVLTAVPLDDDPKRGAGTAADRVHFTVGRRLRNLGLASFNSLPGDRELRAILEQLRDTTGETCDCSVLDGSRIRTTCLAESHSPVRSTFPIDASLPVHTTATGKLYLAYLSARERDTLLRTMTLASVTPKTITSRQALLIELNQIKAQGYALNLEEFTDGMTAIAVPVIAPCGRIISAICLHGPSYRLDRHRLLFWLPQLQDAAAWATKALTIGRGDGAG